MDIDCHGWIAIGPLQLESCEKRFCKKKRYIMGYNLDYQKWKTYIENIKTAKFETPGSLNFRKI